MEPVCYVCGSNDVRFLALEPLPKPPANAAPRAVVFQIDSYCEQCVEKARSAAAKLIRIESVVIEGNGRKPASLLVLQFLIAGFDNLFLP